MSGVISRPTDAISLRGVRVHNLQNLNLDLPLRKLIVLSGVSGSGKSSLAFDTLAAEGQRRYIDSFSAYARQFLDRLERPDADRIDRMPPAIAIRQRTGRTGRRSTVASATEMADYLQLLYAKLGRIVCPGCGRETRSDSPASVQRELAGWAPGIRFLVGFLREVPADSSSEAVEAELRAAGFSRLANLPPGPANPSGPALLVVVDRLTTGQVNPGRLADSLEQAFSRGGGRCLVLPQLADDAGVNFQSTDRIEVDNALYELRRFDRELRCPACNIEFLPPEPRLFSPNSPLGACPACSGLGRVPEISLDRLVPDRSKSLRDGAIVAWTTPAYRHELDELLTLAPDYDIPVDVPFSQLSLQHLELIQRGVPERQFGGLDGFFCWLERRVYRLPIRVFLNRWRTYEPCRTCHGQRLQPQALAVRVGGLNVAEFQQLTIAQAVDAIKHLAPILAEDEQVIAGPVLEQLRNRLAYLQEVGLDYLTLDRPLPTLSAGEAQRVALTAALGTRLVNTLYVLDEPSAGLHPRDTERLLTAIERMRSLRNSVVVVEHEPAFLRGADEVVDIGPGAGSAGGRLVYQGTPAGLLECAESRTGAYLSGRERIARGTSRPPEPAGWLKLRGVRHHNLAGVDAEFPLGVLCVVTGVSGSGKSSLVQETLYPAVCRALQQDCTVDDAGDFAKLEGADQLDEILLVDQTPIGRSSRSNAVTYLHAFDEIRRVFAESPDARLRNFKAGSFSFNSAGGRCPTCEGMGCIDIDMQFLADVSMTCPDCHGARYQREILDVKYRGLNIAEVLALTVRDAIVFFRGQPRLQKRLSHLRSVGLDYITLGQPANTLSGGESQRLKLAACLARRGGTRTLFVLDEPTTGLHFADVAQLLQCFEALLGAGHSLIVIEHNLDLIHVADHVIDLGPEAGAGGGQIVCAGSPDDLCQAPASITGRYLTEWRTRLNSL